jgi:amino acid adenylation domain-containing protein
LHHLLEDAALRAPEQVALIDRKVHWTYAVLNAHAERVAEVLAEAGVGVGDRIAVYAEKAPWTIAALYGISKLGAAYVPLDVAAPVARNQIILERADVAALVTSTAKAADLEAFARDARWRAGVVRLETTGPTGPALDSRTADAPTRARRERVRSFADTRIAYILHTSGSTGVPKGVAISHRNALVFVRACERFGFGPDDRFALHAPLHFDLSVFDLYCAAAARGAVVILPEFFSAFPQKMAEAISEHRVTVWNSVVSALALLLDKGRAAERDTSSLRAIFFSGERMPIPLLRRLREVFAGAKLFNVYGQTEANSSLAYEVATVPSGNDDALPLGDALSSFEVFLLDEAGAVVQGAGTGELCVRSGSVASGEYFRDPERSREKFVVDPASPETGVKIYRTGDVARRDEAGRLFLVGRRDDMVKTRGYRVELAEVERALDELPELAEVAVVPVADPSIGNALVAFVVSAGAADVSAASIAAALRANLPAYMIPDPVVIEPSLPRTSTGKIDKRALGERASRLLGGS